MGQESMDPIIDAEELPSDRCEKLAQDPNEPLQVPMDLTTSTVHTTVGAELWTVEAEEELKKGTIE